MTRSFITFLARLASLRHVIWALAIRNFQRRFVGTGAGILWTIVHPLATVLVFWLVFSLGFKAKGPDGVPFVLYFMTALLPWSLFSDTLLATTGAVTNNQHLVKKMVFPTEVLPIVEILASTFSHLMLLGFTVVLLLLHGIVPGLAILQIGYAYLCACILILGIGWALAAINVFHRDIGQALPTVLSFWFWATPVVWDIGMLPESWRPLLNLNPVHHVVESYRAALLYGRPVWQDLSQMAAFWVMALLLGFLGAYVFRRLKPDFADMM
jgi:lipopolysaccharide transport system permease protein/teichoic acid transport system permease protein